MKYKQQDISIYLDNQKITFDQPAIIVDGRTLVPLRAIFEAMGATVKWDEATKTAVGYGKQNYNVSVTEGSNIAYIDGFPYELDVPVINQNGRLLAPARFVAEAFGGLVEWDAKNQIVKIQSMSAHRTTNRSYDTQKKYTSCYEAAMSNGRLLYIMDGYKIVYLNTGYIGKQGIHYKFINDDNVFGQRYYFDINNKIVTDIEKLKQLDFAYKVNTDDYVSRSEYWTIKEDINISTTNFKENYSNAVNTLCKASNLLEIGYTSYDFAKIVFDQMVIGTIYPPYAAANVSDIPQTAINNAMNLTYDAIILTGLVDSVDTMNQSCDAIKEIYDKYQYGYITSIKDAESYISSVSAQYLLLDLGNSVANYLKFTYPKLDSTDVFFDLSETMVKNFVKIDFDKLFNNSKKVKNVYKLATDTVSFIQNNKIDDMTVIGGNAFGSFVNQKKFMNNFDKFEVENSKYIELLK